MLVTLILYSTHPEKASTVCLASLVYCFWRTIFKTWFPYAAVILK